MVAMPPIKLPAPSTSGRMPLEEAISRRRSVRKFGAQAISLAQLSQLLWAAQGITSAGGQRAVPSAGATYPLELFIIVGEQTVKDLKAGVYQYQINTHSLKLHLQGDVRERLAGAALDQRFIANCPLNIVVCAIFSRTSHRYGNRGNRYVYMEVGHIGQNVSLQAVALGLVTVMVGAFNDEFISEILKLEKQIEPLYIIPTGKPI